MAKQLKILVSGFSSVVSVGGTAVQVADQTIGVFGGIIANPFNAVDQGLTNTESLWVSIIRPADTFSSPGTDEIVPGQKYLVPPSTNVWVNAASSGHKFTAYFTTIYSPVSPPIPVPGQPGSGTTSIAGEFGTGTFPPLGVTGLTNVIPSYLYQEYSDDDDLQGFVAAQNAQQQNYVDTFNALNLPIYTGPIVANGLLDWVGQGLYGMARPVLESGQPDVMGPLNTWGLNWLVPQWDQPVDPNIRGAFGLNFLTLVGEENTLLSNDDIYRRVLTWHFYKGDGQYFNVRWLKRRIWRFLYGTDGTSPESVTYWPNDNSIADTEQISVTMGISRNVAIRFVLGNRKVTGGAMLNAFGCNGFEPAKAKIPAWDIGTDTTLMPSGITPPGGIYINDIETTYQKLPPLPFMEIFKEALDSGVLEVPYQFNFTCSIG